MTGARTRQRWIVVAWTFTLLWAPALRSQDLPPADEVIKKVIERAKRDGAKGEDAEYVYKLRNVVEEFDDRGAPKQRRERLYEGVIVDGRHFNRLIQRDGKPLSEEDRKHEQERERNFRRTLEERKQKKEREKGRDEVELNEELFGRYKVEIVSREQVNGRQALVATFAPKGKDLPTRRRIDIVLNKMAGKVWIDDQDFEIQKVQFHLTEPVGKLLGLLASVRKFDGSFEQTRLDEGEWFPLRLNYYLEGRIFLKSLHQRTKLEWTGLRKAVKESAKQGMETR